MLKYWGEMDGQPIYREENSFDRLEKVLEEEQKKHLDRMAGLDEEPSPKKELDEDAFNDR
jgi:hypothetical protein